MRPSHIEDFLCSLHTGQWFGWSDSKNKIYSNLVILDKTKSKPTEKECTDGLAQMQTDFDNAKMYFFVDGTEIHGQDISAGTAASNLSGWSTSSNWIFHFATVTASNNSARSNIIFNFGQEGTFAGTQTAGGNSDGNGIGNFKHSVPSGFLALCTQNLGS